jgi:TetR/AcrR family transcriptional regulator, transcriptional repressor for nem operon
MKTTNEYSKSARTRQYIIEKVAPVFNRKGYWGTSLRDLTDATGLSKGSIYGHFKNKDAIAIEAFNYNLSIIVSTFNSEISQAKSSVGKLLAFPKVYRKIYRNIITIGGCPILNTATDADDTHPKLKELAQRALLNLKKAIESIIADGILINEIKPDINPDAIAGNFLALIEGGFLVSKLTGKEKYFENSLLRIEQTINEIRV